jgi:gamma-glutamyl hydrolase
MNKTSGTEGLLVPLDFTDAGRTSSRIMAKAPAAVANALSTLPITVNLHSYGIYTSVVEGKGSKLHDYFSVVASNTDADGTKFVSLIEARDFPFYGSQFHGEKNSFEWDQG